MNFVKLLLPLQGELNSLLVIHEIERRTVLEGIKDERGLNILDAGYTRELIVDEIGIAGHVSYSNFEKEINLTGELVDFEYLGHFGEALFYIL